MDNISNKRNTACAVASYLQCIELADRALHAAPDVIGEVDINIAEDNVPTDHVIAFNTWQGEGAPPPPPNSIGLRYFMIVLPNRTELERVGEQVQKAGIAVEQTQDGLLVRDPPRLV